MVPLFSLFLLFIFHESNFLMSDNITEKNTSISSSRSYDYANDSWVPKIKRRRRFSSEETKILEGEYDKNSSPNQDKIQSIADIIDTPRKIVTTWFQNRRAKNKRKEKTKREDKAKRNKVRLRSSTSSQYSMKEQDENETNFESNDEYTPDGIYYGDSSSSNSQPSYNTSILQETPIIEDGFDLTFDTSTLIAQPHASQHININDPDFLPVPPNNNINQYYGLSQNNQQYNINIYNNMNNYFYPHELYEENFTRGIRNMYSWNQTHLYNFFYYQQQQQYQNDIPFFINNSINRGMFPFLMNIPPTPAITDETSSELYINPSDLCLNYHTPQRRRENQEDYD